MTVTNVDLHSGSAKRLLVERTKSYLIFTLCAALYILPFMRIYMLGTDEGTLDYGAVRIMHGQVFARDFFEVIGPGTFYWLAAFFKVFGISFFASRICLFVTSLGTAVLMYGLSRRICGRYRVLPVLVLAGAYFGGLWPAISHHVDSNFFALLSVACMVLWVTRRSKGLLIAAGICAGLTTAILQPKGALLFGAFLIWLWILRRREAIAFSCLGIIAAAYLSALGLIGLFFWSKGALHSLIYVNFVWPSQHYEGVNSVHYANGILTNYWDHWVRHGTGMGWTMPMASVLIVPILFIAVLPALLLVQGVRYKWAAARPEVLLYSLCGTAMWAAELHRKDMTHLVFGSPLLIIVSVYFLAEYRRAMTGALLQLLSITSVCLAAVNLFVLMAAHSTETRVGPVSTFRELPALGFLQSHVQPGDEIFAYPYCPKYYFLTSTTNPTPYSILTYNYNTVSQFNDVVRIFEERKVKYVVWDVGFAAIESQVFPGSRPPAGGFIVEPYLEAHYKTVETLDGIRVLERNETSDAD